MVNDSWIGTPEPAEAWIESHPTTPESAADLGNTITIGPYRIIERLAAGRLGVVYRARWADRDRSVAVTFLTGLPLDPDGRMLSRFHEQLSSVAELAHPHILPVLDHGLDDGIPYTVADYLDGGNLTSRLGSPMAPDLARPIARAIAGALDYAHARGTVHGSLDPSAVLFQPNGSLALTGFGYAPLVWLVPPARRAALLAERRFLSPEQLDGDPATVRSDVWSFAALLYAMLTGSAPESWTTDRLPRPSASSGRLAPSADQAILAALSNDPAKRPAAAGELFSQVFPPVTAVVRRRPLLLYERRPSLPPDIRPRTLAGARHLIDRDLAEPSFPPAVEPLTFPDEAPVRSRWRSRPFELAVGVAIGLVIIVSGGRWLEGLRPRPIAPAVASITTAAPPGVWTMQGNNPAHTAAAIEVGGSLEGKIAWQATLGVPVTAGPVAGSAGVVAGLADGRVVALDPATGTARWEFKATGAVEAGPALADGLVFVGLRDGRVVALDSSTGGLRWEQRTAAPMSAAPVAVDGVLYAGSNDGRLYAYDAASGALRWSYDAGAAIAAPPTVGNGLALVATREGRVHIVDLETGSNRWIYRAGGAIEGPVTLAGGLAYVATDRGILHALDPFVRGGPFEWEWRTFQAQLYLWGLPVGPPGPQPGYRWSFDAESPIVGGLAVHGGRVYLPGTDGRLQAIAAMSGERQWSSRFNGPIVAGPILAGDLLYVGGEDGRVSVLDATSGDRVWDVALAGRIRTSPAMSRATLFVGTDAGRLYAIR